MICNLEHMVNATEDIEETPPRVADRAPLQSINIY
jgi:hypothetical protein